MTDIAEVEAWAHFRQEADRYGVPDPDAYADYMLGSRAGRMLVLGIAARRFGRVLVAPWRRALSRFCGLTRNAR